MTSTAARKPKSRRSLVWAAVFVAALFGAYSAGWFYLADRVRTEAAQAIAAINVNGVNADCVNLAVSGYPLRFAVTCDALAYEDDARNIAASSGSISAVAPFLQPMSPVISLTGPLRTTAPGIVPLWLDWDRLRADTSLSWPLPERIALHAEGFSGQTDPQDETDPVQLFSAGKAETILHPSGADLDVQVDFNDLQIDAEAVGGRVLPPLDGIGDATLKNGLTLLATQPKSLRGQAIDFRQLDLSSGTAGVSIAGPISVDADGLIDANLTIKIQNPGAVSAHMVTAIPELKRQIEQGFSALALLGNAPSMPLKIVKGKASLGFIPLGRIGPVE